MAGDRPETPAPDRHRLPAAQLAALAAGGGDADTVASLLTAERSWRLIQLRAVLDIAGTGPEVCAPLAPLPEAWELLVAAQQAAPSEVEQLLLHPQVGTWAGYALRRLRGVSTGSAPLWVDLGYLHALAAAAAIRAGLPCQLSVPVREGFVVLPSLGSGRLSTGERWRVAEVRAGDDEITITAGDVRVQVPRPAAASPEVDGWWPLPRVEAEAGGHRLAVTLDHLDPYRNLRGPTPPEPLAPESRERWQTLLTRAWELIVAATPQFAPAIAAGLFAVVPQPAAERFRTMSASAGDAFGATIVSEPEDAPELAVTLVHEFQHIKLGGLLHLAPLHHAEPAQRLYAPWRDDPRPLGGLLQGVYAFVGITEFWRALREHATGRTARLAQFEFARWRAQVPAVLTRLRALPELTALGRELVAGLTGTAGRWWDERVPADVDRAGVAAATDHRTRWRLHHLRPDPQEVAAFAAGFSSGGRAPVTRFPEPSVVADDSARRLDTRAVLTLWRLTDPDGFARLEKDPAGVGGQVSGAGPADLAYVVGDLSRAAELYRTELLMDPASASAWAGLGLVESARESEPAATALRARPELVRAVFERVAGSRPARPGQPPADPLAVASWVGAALR